MNHTSAVTRYLDSRTRSILAPGLLLVLSAAVCYAQWRSLASSRATYDVSIDRLATMQADADRITSLGSSPRQATDRKLPHDQLARHIEEACERGKIPMTALTRIRPEAPRRLRQSDYTQFLVERQLISRELAESE